MPALHVWRTARADLTVPLPDNTPGQPMISSANARHQCQFGNQPTQASDRYSELQKTDREYKHQHKCLSPI